MQVNPLDWNSDQDGRQLELEQLDARLRDDDSAEPPAWLMRRVSGLMRPPGRPKAGERLVEVLHVVARLVYDSRPQPALAGFRGGTATTVQASYHSELGSVDLKISPRRRPRGSGGAGAGREGWLIEGQVSAAERPRLTSVSLLRSGSGDE